MSQVALLLGTIMAVAVAAQALSLGWGTIRRTIHQQTQRRTQLAVLEARLGVAERQRQTGEQKQLQWAGWRKFRVARKVHANADCCVCSFYLTPHDEKPIPDFTPGQFLTFRVKIPGRDTPVVRCYSLSDVLRTEEASGKPLGTYRVTIKRVPLTPQHPSHESASNHFHDNVSVGDILGVQAPSGTFTLDPASPLPVVLMAGGVGITPLLCMLNSIVESSTGREIWFFYGVGNPGEVIMADHLESISRNHDNVRMHICYARPLPDDGPEQDGHHFVIHSEQFVTVDLVRRILASQGRPRTCDFFLCGPPPMMAAILSGLKTWGVPDEHVHWEKFGPPPAPEPIVMTPEMREQSGVEVTFAKSGRTVVWSPKDGTLLQLALANGIHIDSGCQVGSCSTCETAIRTGRVEYSRLPERTPQAGSCFVCCAVPNGPVELEA